MVLSLFVCLGLLCVFDPRAYCRGSWFVVCSDSVFLHVLCMLFVLRSGRGSRSVVYYFFAGVLRDGAVLGMLSCSLGCVMGIDYERWLWLVLISVFLIHLSVMGFSGCLLYTSDAADE